MKRPRAKAAVFVSPSRGIELRELPLGKLQAGWIRASVEYCTLCGSDLHTYFGRRQEPTPSILGHEIVGVVREFAPQASPSDAIGNPLAVGDRITWSICASCDECFYCLRGVSQKCEQLRKYGHSPLDGDWPLSGGLAEWIDLPPGTSVFRLPNELVDELAAPAMCATATVMAALRTAGKCGGAVAAVLGAGMLGLTAAAALKDAGASHVIVSDVSATRLDLARKFGATHAVNVAKGDEQLNEIVQACSDGRGADIVLEMSGAAAGVRSALDIVRVAGRVVLVGSVFPGQTVAIDPEQVVRRLLRVTGVHNYAPNDLGAALRFLSESSCKALFAGLIEKRFTLEQANEAFQYAEAHKPFRVAVRP